MQKRIQNHVKTWDRAFCEINSTIFAKLSTLDVWQGSEYDSVCFFLGSSSTHFALLILGMKDEMKNNFVYSHLRKKKTSKETKKLDILLNFHKTFWFCFFWYPIPIPHWLGILEHFPNIVSQFKFCRKNKGSFMSYLRKILQD